MMVLSAPILSFAHELASALINELDVIRYTVIFIYILGAAQPLMGIEFSLSGCLRGAGDTRTHCSRPWWALLAFGSGLRPCS